ncbi:MAG: hypothetical protein AB7L90_21700 [Hyphomicrobiaceae bacterium]
MADRTSGKAKKRAKTAPGRATKAGGGSAGRSAALPANLEAEFERTKAALEAAEGRIRELEAQRKHLLDRINWAIDSLTSLQDT